MNPPQFTFCGECATSLAGNLFGGLSSFKRIGRVRLFVSIVVAVFILGAGLVLLTGAFGDDELELRGYSETKYQRYVTATESAGKDPLDRGAWLEKERIRETEIRLGCLEAIASGTDMSFMYYCD